MTFEIRNLTLTDADTEYALQLPPNTSFFSFQCRTSVEIRYAFVTGKVATPTAPFMTLKSAAAYNSHGVDTSDGFTIFFASGTAGVIVEIESF